MHHHEMCINSYLRHILVVMCFAWGMLANAAESTSTKASLPDLDTGSAFFTSGGKTYAGQFSLTDSTLGVTIEGMNFKGGFAKTVPGDVVLPTAVASSGNWGRAFLFGSSADVLQCRLDAGFPALAGECVRTDGRKFLLKAQSQ